jgi:hypothetical protein
MSRLRSIDDAMVTLSDQGFECASVGNAIYVYGHNDFLVGKMMVDDGKLLLNGYRVELNDQLFDDMRATAQHTAGAQAARYELSMEVAA